VDIFLPTTYLTLFWGLFTDITMCLFSLFSVTGSQFLTCRVIELRFTGKEQEAVVQWCIKVDVGTWKTNRYELIYL